MDHDRLRALLNSLHQELGGSPSVDAESRRLLGTVMSDIDRVMQQPGGATGATQVSSRLETLIVHFEADHPAVAGAMRQLIDALGKAGI
jgi:hypothetical protein